MSFVHQDQNVLIQGVLGLSKTMIILRTQQKIASQEVEMMFMLWVTESNHVEQIDLTNQESLLQQVLTGLATIFQEPKGLPPSREVDH